MEKAVEQLDLTAVEVATMIVPCIRFCRKHGIISFYSVDTPGFGVQVNKKDFLRIFTEYTVEKIEGNREQAVAVVNGIRFFALLTEESYEDVQTSSV